MSHQLTTWENKKEDLQFAANQLEKNDPKHYEWKQNKSGKWAIFIESAPHA